MVARYDRQMSIKDIRELENLDRLSEKVCDYLFDESIAVI